MENPSEQTMDGVVRWLAWPPFSRTRRPDRHFSYFDLVEALELSGCPLCRLEGRVVERYLDMLSWECVNDPGVRAHLRQSRGFCNSHAWQFREEVGDGLGTAIIYGDVVENLLADLDQSGHRRSPAWLRWRLPAVAGLAPGQDAADALQPHGSCPACDAQSIMREGYLDTLVAHLDEPDFRAAFEQSDGLCLPHLRLTLHASPTPDTIGLLLPRQTAFSDQPPPLPKREHLSIRPNARGESRFPVNRLAAGLMGAPWIAHLCRTPSARAVVGVQPTHAQTEDLQAALRIGECPICCLAGGTVAAYLRSLAEEVQATQSGGPSDEAAALCPNHFWQMLGMASPAEETGVCESVAHRVESRVASGVETLSRVARAGGTSRFPWQQPNRLRAVRTVEAMLHQHPCPACAVRSEVERDYGRLLGKVLAGERARGTGRLPALCLPHLVVTLRHCHDAGEWAALAQVQQATWAGLLDEINEYIRKQDYRFREEPWGEEKSSPWRAIEQVAGRKGIRP